MTPQTTPPTENAKASDQPIVRNVPTADGVWMDDDGVRFDLQVGSACRLGDLQAIMDKHDGYEAIVGLRDGELMLAVKGSGSQTIEDAVGVADHMLTLLDKWWIGGKMLHRVGA